MYDKFFENIPQIGTLYFEKELFSFENISIVFVCVDMCNNRYLCVCDDIIDEESWIITQVTNKELLTVLNDEDTVLSVYKNKNVIVASKPFGRDVRYINIAYDEIDQADLPLSDQYLEMKDYLQDYICKIGIPSTIRIPMPQISFDKNDFERYIMMCKTTHEQLRCSYSETYEQSFAKSTESVSNVSYRAKLEYAIVESEEYNDNISILYAA